MNRILEFKDKDLKTGKIKSVGKMEIKNKTDDFAELYFYGDIVSSSWGKWEKEDKCPQDVADFLNSIKDVKNLNIYINSGGGSVFAGLSIYHQIKRHPAHKTVHVDGLAASIASVIALSGDRIIIPTTAQFMIHSPWSIAIGNAKDFRKMADDLDKIETSIINVYKENLKDGIDISTIVDMVHAETWLNGEEATKYFNVEVSDEAEAVACISQYFDQYRNVPNNLINKDNSPKPQITNSQKAQKLRVELELI